MAPVRYRYVSSRDVEQQQQEILTQQTSSSTHSGNSSPLSSPPSSTNMAPAPLRYRYISSRDAKQQQIEPQPSRSGSSSPPSSTSSSALPSSGAVALYTSLKRASEALALKQQSQNVIYHTLLQKLVVSQWKECVERRKRLAWKVLVALRMKRVMGKTPEMSLNKLEEEAGMLCLVS